MFGRNALRRIRFDEFLDRYVENHLKIQVAKSWKSEMGRVHRIAAYVGDTWIDRITPSDVDLFLSELRRNGLSPATVNRYRARFSSMMNRAVAWGYREDNPVRKIPQLKEERLPDRYLKPEDLSEEIDGAAIDVSFISLKLVVPLVSKLLLRPAYIVALIKPQFEVGKHQVGKGGVVRDPSLHQEVIHDLSNHFECMDWTVVGHMASPILGPKGNREFFIYLKR